MESNAPCLVLPNNADNYSNFLSTGYLEDALIEFSVHFKRRKLTLCSTNNAHHDQDYYIGHDDPLAINLTDDLSYWNNWLTNYSMHSEEFSHASLLANHHDLTNYYAGEIMEKQSTMKEMCEEDQLNYYQETNTELLQEIFAPISPKLQEMSTYSTKDDDNSITTKSTSSTDDHTYSTDSSSISAGYKEIKKKKRVSTTNSSATKMVYPFGLVKPGGEDGDVTLNDINRRISMPPTRPLKHPVGDYAYRPAVTAHGPGLSGKAVVALTKIHTQGRGTITIIRTKG